MIPLLIISNNKRTSDKFIKTLVKKADLFFEISASEQQYLITDIKLLLKEVKIFFREKRFFLLNSFENSSIEAQNAMLKILEESPLNTQFILTTANENLIIPTIRSRSKIIRLIKNKKEEIDPEYNSFFQDLVKKPSLNFFTNTKFVAKKNEEATSIINQLILFFKNRLFKDNKSHTILKETLRMKGLLETNNLNPQLTIDRLLTFIYKTYSIKI